MNTERTGLEGGGGKMKKLSVLLLGMLGVCLISQISTNAIETPEVWLVSPEEASMPGAPDIDSPRPRGIPPSDIGPIIEVLEPVMDKLISVPTQIAVQFVPRRAPIAIDSLKVVLLKFISIDITERVKPYVSSAGIHVPNAKFPSGQHDLRITLADTEGNISDKQFTLTIR